MFVLEYSICDSKDGLENWEDHTLYLPSLEKVSEAKALIRSEYKGALVIFEDIYTENVK